MLKPLATQCPFCAHPLVGDMCTGCDIFQCSLCRKFVPNDEGGADATSCGCSRCWVKRYRQRKVAVCRWLGRVNKRVLLARIQLDRRNLGERGGTL